MTLSIARSIPTESMLESESLGTTVTRLYAPGSHCWVTCLQFVTFLLQYILNYGTVEQGCPICGLQISSSLLELFIQPKRKKTNIYIHMRERERDIDLIPQPLEETSQREWRSGANKQDELLMETEVVDVSALCHRGGGSREAESRMREGLRGRTMTWTLSNEAFYPPRPSKEFPCPNVAFRPKSLATPDLERSEGKHF